MFYKGLIVREIIFYSNCCEQKVGWKNWMEGLPEYVITKEMKFSDIIIPTMDTTRLNFLLEHLLTNNKTVS